MTRLATTRVADLREPPIVGQFYLVPTVMRYPYHGTVSDWPVLGALHNDREHFSFVDAHYHVDARFLSARQRSIIERNAIRGETVEESVNRFPLFYRTAPHRKGRPDLRRRRCTLATYGFAHLHEKAVRSMQDAFGPEPEPIRKPDGRLLCPHRKVDLSQFPADKSGFVICPLHGLRVRCGGPMAAAIA